jgi:hypothetical protein
MIPLQPVRTPSVHTTSRAAVGLQPTPQVGEPDAYNDEDAQQKRLLKAAERPDESSPAGLSPADITWLQGVRFNAKTIQQLQDEADARAKADGKVVIPQQALAADLAQRQNMTPRLDNDAVAKMHSSQQTYATTGRPGNTLAEDPLAVAQGMTKYLDNAGIHYPVLPTSVMDRGNPNEITMSIASQLEARRRALGGAVDLASPWNAVMFNGKPGAF